MGRAVLPSAGATEAVWLQVTRGDTITRDAPITAAAINNVVQRRASAAGLENALGYSAHSLRAGFVTEAKNRGIDEADIMRHTRHKSVQIMRRYDRTSGLWIRNATTTGLRQAIRRQHQIGLGMAEPSTDHVHRNRAVSDKDARCGVAEIVKANPGNIQPV